MATSKQIIRIERRFKPPILKLWRKRSTSSLGRFSGFAGFCAIAKKRLAVSKRMANIQRGSAFGPRKFRATKRNKHVL